MSMLGADDAMTGLTPVEILDAWEHGAHPRRIRAIQAIRDSDPVGAADAALLSLRAATFGPTLAALTDCPRCGDPLEFDAPIAGLLSAPASAAPQAPSLRDAAAFHWSGAATRVDYRLPTYADLDAVAALGDAVAAEAALFARCVLHAEHEGQAVPAAALPAEIRTAVAHDMARHDPQAELTFALDCPACGHAWSSPFDVGTFFWSELAAEARRLLAEVHILARAYGWREPDVLALSPMRRRAYLELVQS